MRTERLELWLSHEELELLERNAEREGAVDLASWARRRLLSAVSDDDTDRSSPPRQSVVNWAVPVRRMSSYPPPEEEDLSIPVHHREAVLKRK